MATDEAARRRAGQTIYQERARRGWSVETAMQAGGVGHMTWRRLERGDAVQPKSYRAVDRAFEWPLGHTHAAIEAGADLIDSEGHPLEPPPPRGQAGTQSQPLTDIEEHLETLSYFQLIELRRTVDQLVKSYDEKLREINDLLRSEEHELDPPGSLEFFNDMSDSDAKLYMANVYEYSNLYKKVGRIASQVVDFFNGEQDITMTKLNDLYQQAYQAKEGLEETSRNLVALDPDKNLYKTKNKDRTQQG